MNKLLSPRTGKASYPTAVVVVGGGASSGGDGGGGDDELGTTEARGLREQDKPSSDDAWPIVIGSQKGGKGDKVIPVADGIV